MGGDWLLIGIGGAGCAMATHVHAAIGGRVLHVNRKATGTTPHSNTFGALNPYAVLSASQIHDHMQGARGTLTGELGDEPLVFVFAGLGGATGSGAAPAVTRLAVELGRETHVLVTMPFDYETGARSCAHEALAQVRASNVFLHVHDHAMAASRERQRALSMNALLGLAETSALAYCVAHRSKQAA